MEGSAPILDLFCGAGGFSLGAHKAGFKVGLSIDIDPILTSSYEQNFPASKLVRADIATLTRADIEAKAKVKLNDIAGVIGGPPCQGFSTIGKRSSSDPRNALIGHFFRLVKSVKPKFFVMENVPGLMSGDFKDPFEKVVESVKGFTILGPLIVDASDYGAATSRRRVIVVGFDPERMNCLTEADLLPRRNQTYTVKDAISDLPEPGDSEWSEYVPVSDLSKYASRAREVPNGRLGAPDYKRRARKNQISGFQKTVHTKEVLSRLSGVEQGTCDSISRCPRLHWDRPAPTLRAGTGPANGSYQSIRPIHPQSDRVITVREAARLQGFPDWYKFHPTKWHSFRMIGNSVSPMLASSVLRKISSKL